MIELEHTLIMLLLLISLLRTRTALPVWVRLLMVGVIFLAFLAPAAPLALPWGLFAALFIPLLLWQTAQRLGGSAWFGGWRDVVVWLVLTAGISTIIYLTGGLPVASALLFGLLAASFVLNAIHPEQKETLFSQIGVLTLVFLLTEIEATVEAPGRFLLALLGGGGIGVVVGLAAVLLARRLPEGPARDAVSVGQGYLAYGLGLAAGMSAVAAALLSIAVTVAYGTRRGLWPDGQITPKPFRSPVVYAAGVAALAFFGWQTHVPFTPTVLLEVVLALALTTLVYWIGQRANGPAPAMPTGLLETLFRVGFLLAAALLLWPKSMLIDPLPLGVSLGFAAVTAVGASILLAPMLQVLSWLEQARREPPTGSQPAAPTLRVSDLMRTDFAAVPPDAPVEDVQAALAAHPAACVLVTEPSGRLAGIITEADLFVKQEKLPRTDVTYLALFEHPVKLENIVQAYQSLREQMKAADIMTQPVVTIQSDRPVGQAVQLFIAHGYKILPVVAAGGEARVIGLLTRADMIRHFLGAPE